MNDNRSAVGLLSGTLVLTSDGYREIENIKTGDLMLTHKCRWRKVIGVITGQDKVGTFQGNVKISMTSDVNIYSAIEVTHYPADEDGKRKATRNAVNAGAMQLAAYMKDLLSATPRVIEDQIPGLMNIKLPRNPWSLLCADFWYITGKYLLNRLRPDEVSQRTDIIPDAQNFTWWMHGTFGTFGTGVRSRQIPPFIFTLPIEYRKAFLSGVMDSSGSISDVAYRLNSSNKKMIYALRFLAESVDYYTNVAFTELEKQSLISGRTVNQSSRYTLAIFDGSCRPRGIRSDDGKFTWYHCSGFTMADEIKTVYNLAVGEDNTFFADSICVSTNIF